MQIIAATIFMITLLVVSNWLVKQLNVTNNGNVTNNNNIWFQ